MHMSQIKTGPCNNILYNVAINILNEVTGEEWGFVQPKIKISYITCKNIGIKLAAKIGRSSKKIDYYITTRATTPDWENTLRFELYKALFNYLRTSTTIEKGILERVMPKLKQFMYNGISIDECVNIDLTNCKEIYKYRDTFVKSKNDWIQKDGFDDKTPRILTREDFL